MATKKNGISLKQLSDMSTEFQTDRGNRIAAAATFNGGLINAATDPAATAKLPFSFSIDLKQGKITNQRASGRCWIFAALNVFRYEIIKKYDLDTFELSQNYLFFYDKLEKANFYLESILETTDEPLTSRLFQFINGSPLADGGQWDMLSNLVEKYGVVPKEAYPDAKNAELSRWFDQYLSTRLREDAMLLREAVEAGGKPAELQRMKKDMLKEFYRMLCISLGEPPKTFDLTLRSKENKVTQEFGITPQEFFQKYVGMNLSDYVSIIHAPTKDKPYGKKYTVRFLGNVADGRPISYLNLEMDKIKKAVVKQLKDGHPVWFGSDCSKYGAREAGIFDRDSLAVEQLFDIKYRFTKEQSLDYGDSAMNHAMVILGTNLNEKGKTDRWRIENSWGKDAGRDGYYVASDSWFDDYVYQVVVNKKYLDAASRKLLDQKEIQLEPWDPFGTLAD